MGLVLDNLDLYARGMGVTVVLTLLSYAVALVIGILVALARVGPVPPLRVAAAVYVESLRNVPLAVLILLFYFGFTKIGVRYSEFTSAAIVLGAYTSTFVAETIRSGINAVGRGQVEAARALGLGFGRVVTSVVLPQAWRTVVAPLGSVFIALTKNSALASLIDVGELTDQATELGNVTARYVPVLLGAAGAYLLLTLPSGWAVGALERRVAFRR